VLTSGMQGRVCNYLGGHRANLLLHGAKWIGVAHAQNGRRMYWALVIGGEMKGTGGNYSFLISFIVITPSSRSAVNETLSPGFTTLNIRPS